MMKKSTKHNNKKWVFLRKTGIKKYFKNILRDAVPANKHFGA